MQALHLPPDDDGNPPALLHARVEVTTVEDHHTIRKEYLVGKPGTLVCHLSVYQLHVIYG